MNAGTAAQLASVAGWIEERLDDETAGRQYIAEQAAARIRDIVLQLGERPRPDLLGYELTIAQAIADAIRWRRAQAVAAPERSRGGHAEQIGLYRGAAEALGLAELLGTILGTVAGDEAGQ